MKNTRTSKWAQIAVLCLTFFTVVGCSESKCGDFTSSTTGEAAGALCQPARVSEACFGNQRMKCDPGKSEFVTVENCPNGTTCKEKTSCAEAGLKEAVCDGTPIEVADAGAVDGESSADGTTEDTAKPAGGKDKDDPVCKRWLDDRADMTEGKWDGDFASCKIGELDKTGHDNALKIMNLYRFLSGLPEVKEDPDFGKKAQACATLMGANDNLSHTPPKAWKCWTDDGAEAADSANLSTAPAVLAMDRYVVDEGAVNEKGLGHRRWMLSAQLGPVGIGSTNDTVDATGQASCVWVKGTSTHEFKNDFVAWPPEGKLPLSAIRPHAKYGSIDETGWSIHSDTLDFAAAKVVVKAGSKELAIKLRTLTAGGGSKQAIAFVPDGWQSEAGQTYEVTVSGATKDGKANDFFYFVQILDCE